MQPLHLCSLLAVVGVLLNSANAGLAPVNKSDLSAGKPFPLGITDMPDRCYGQNPSDDCFNAGRKKRNDIWFDKNSGCSEKQKAQIVTAVWDATTLASYASASLNRTTVKGQASGVFWMGSDWTKYQSRISGNLGRIGKWKLSDQNDYITVSCADPKNKCNKEHNGTKVGGYSKTYLEWPYYYYNISLCPPFFTLDSLNDKLKFVENGLNLGNTRYATEMSWLKTTGQYFLHEMMHLRIANGGDEPHITDEYVTTARAYGPFHVHMLVKQDGADIASTNSDSYVLLANCLWWWNMTGYFPGIPGKTPPKSAIALIQLP